MATLKKLTGQELNAPTLFAADTLANLSQPRAKEKARTTPVTYGLGLENVLAFLDPVTQSWKMYEATCLLGELPSLEKLPISGIAWNGVLYLRPAWVPITDESASFSWPTPTTVDTFTPKSRKNPTLGDAARMRPITNEEPPTIQEFNQERETFPTPRASTAMNEDLATVRKRLDNGKKWGAKLEQTVALHPTPKYMDNQSTETTTLAHGGKLNPTWIEWLMGFPLGWTDLED
jgi:hypothetical protein